MVLIDGGVPGLAQSALTTALLESRRAGCQRCGAAKPPGKGRRLCDSCAPPSGQRMCHACGDVPVNGKGVLFCLECAEIRREASVIRKKARERRLNKPCRGCGGVKPPGRRRAYCDACTAARRETPLPTCQRCGERPVRARQAKICVDCKVESVREHKAYKRRWAKARGYVAPNGVKSPEQHRFSRRVSMDRKGIVLEPVVVVGTRQDAERFPNLPSMPLARMVLREIEVLAAGPFVKGKEILITGEDGKYRPLAEARRGDDVLSATATVCERVGASDRTLRRWITGEQPTVRFDVADKIIGRADLLWFDVYEPCRVGCESLPVGPVCSACDAHIRARIAFEGE